MTISPCGVRLLLAPTLRDDVAGRRSATRELLDSIADEVPTRALSIGMRDIAFTPWSERHELWTATLPKLYVNVVVAPCNLPMGASLAVRNGNGTMELVYEPQTAFASLWLQGCHNVAVVLPHLAHQPRDVGALAALNRYDRVYALVDDVSLNDTERVSGMSASDVARGILELCRAVDRASVFNDH